MKTLFSAALAGGLLGFALFWPNGAFEALLGAQLGAISLPFLVCPALALRRAKVEREQNARFRLYRVVERTEPVVDSLPTTAVLSKNLRISQRD
jgi:hypothetical protein